MTRQCLSRRFQKEPEGQFLERKSCFDLKGRRPKRRLWKQVAQDIAETLVAFANADGGDLVVGLDDDGTVSGIPYGAGVIEKLTAVPQSRIHPRLSSDVLRFRKNGKLVLLFRLGPSASVHRTTAGKYLYRSRDQNLPMDADKIRHLKALKLETLAEHAVIPDARLADLDSAQIARVGDKMGIGADPVGVLETLRMIERANGGHRLTLASLLLFAKDPAKWHPRAYVEYLRFRGKERKHGKEFNLIKRERIEAPPSVLADRVISAIKPQIAERHELVDLFFEERMEYPEFAWQEAIVNAIAHRDYGIRGTPIEIHHFDDRLEVVSPGSVVPPVTLSKLKEGGGVHASRNPLLVRVLTALGYMKEVGEGIPRMFREMEMNGLQPPAFDGASKGLFKVTLQNAPVWDRPTLKWLGRFKPHNLSRNQMRLMVYAKEHAGKFTSAEYQRLTGMDIYSASSDIKDMLRKGLIEKTKKGGRVYLLSFEDVASRRDQRFPVYFTLIQKYLRRQTALTNRDLQRIWKVNRLTAWRRVKRLIEMGWLVREGEKRGARYVSGPRDKELQRARV